MVAHIKEDRRTPMELLTELVRLPGATVVDVGCGEGELVRALAKRGAHVTGVECNPIMLSRARAATAVADERYLEGGGEALPLADASADLVIFANSLHHVPVAEMGKALAEAARVLRPGGHCVVIEPLAEGAFFALVRPVDDETEVRARAQEALVAQRLLEPVRTVRYLSPVRFDGFEAFADRIASIDPGRRARLAAVRDDLERAFLASAERRDGAFHFDQPARLDLLLKKA